MPEIGATLREARMRAKIDISDIETETKIRAKYLRALENEEWDLLPGPTYVRTFLRTYAEALGLDAKLLVEEYRLRYEARGSEPEFAPIAPLGRDARARQRTRRPSARVSRGGVIAVGVAALLGALFLLGTLGDENDEPTSATRTVPSTPAGTETGAGEETAEEPASEERKPARRPAVVRLQVRPAAAVWVCLQNAKGERLIAGREVSPGEPLRTYRSRRFRITVGNGQVVLRVNGRAFDVPDRSDAVGYEITSRGRRELSESQRPLCA